MRRRNLLRHTLTEAGDLCERDGFTVQRVTDAQALVIDGDRQHIV